MALIECPECGHDVSDKAVSCPRCGYPMQLASEPQSNIDREAAAEQPAIEESRTFEGDEPEPYETKWNWKMLAAMAALLLGLIVAIIVNVNGLKRQPTANNVTTAPVLTIEPTDAPTAKASSTPKPTSKPTAKPTSTPKPTPTPTPTPTPEPWVYNGMYKVGTDIEPGEYFLVRNGSTSAYFETAEDSNGSSIIANGIFSAHSYLTVKSGEYVRIENAKMIKIEYAPALTLSDTAKEGMYKIGRDLPAGEYKVCCNQGENNAYVEIMRDSRHTSNSTIMNDIFSGERYVTVKDGQYLYIMDGYIKLG